MEVKEVEGKVAKVTLSFTMSDMPLPVWKRFKSFAEQEASGCYWMAVQKLLDSYSEESRYDTIVKLLLDFKEALVEGREEEKVEEPVLTLGRG